VVEHSGRINGYSTGLGLRGYAIGEMTDDLKALISFAPAIMGLGFFVPSATVSSPAGYSIAAIVHAGCVLNDEGAVSRTSWGIPAFDRISTEKKLMSPRTIVD